MASRANQDRCKKGCGVAGGGNDGQRRAREAHDVHFIGVDGEGVNGWAYEEVWSDEENDLVMRRVPTHDYVLLSVGDQSLHRDGRKLNHDEIFAFLWEQYQANPDAAFVGFFLGYDFTHWLRSLHAERAWKLLTRDGIASRARRGEDAIPRPWPVRVGAWEFDLLINKRFMLRPFVKREDQEMRVVNHKDGTASVKAVARPWMYVCDSGPFFQSSFLTAIDPDPKKWQTPICTSEEFATIKEGKDRRADAGFDPAMIRYNILENEILSRLMTTVNEGLVGDNIRLSRQQWFGPGQAAQKWLDNVNCPPGEIIREAVPQWARDAARESYYGGWFEIFAHGVIPDESYGYDINSAYPHGISGLPCLLHGQWRHGEGRMVALRKGSLRLVDATVTGRDPRVGVMPFRRADGTILRPQHASGWYWWDELQAAKRAGLVTSIKVTSWVEYDPCACPPPLAEIRELYDGRLAVGKNTSAGKGKKLIYNSSYGKLAQSVGSPKFANAIYASRITSVCRSMILDAIATHPGKTRDLLMVATDSVVFKTRHPSLDIDGNRLGAWDETVHQNLSLFMPGIYWDDKSRAKIAAGQAPELKSRGVSAKDLARMIDKIDAKWKSIRTNGFKQWPRMELPVDFQMTTAKQAIVRGDWPTCGKVVSCQHPGLPHGLRCAHRDVNAIPTSKRQPQVFWNAQSGYIYTVPWDYAHDKHGNVVIRTTPYAKAFGEEDRENDPDTPITPDGDIRGLIQQAILPR